jgi:hypothetical protein
MSTHPYIDEGESTCFRCGEPHGAPVHTATPPPVATSARWPRPLGNFTTADTHTVRPEDPTRTACGRAVVETFPGHSYVSCHACRRSVRWPVAY